MPALLVVSPPAINISPPGRSVAVCSDRAVPSELVGDQVLAAGLYTSTLLVAFPVPSVWPPATRTVPSGSEVALKSARAVFIGAAELVAFVTGSNSSALEQYVKAKGLMPFSSTPP